MTVENRQIVSAPFSMLPSRRKRCSAATPNKAVIAAARVGSCPKICAVRYTDGRTALLLHMPLDRGAKDPAKKLRDAFLGQGFELS